MTKTPLRLALASDYVEGLRLSEMLAVADERLIPLEISAAFGVIRQLTAALAALHQESGASHGALEQLRSSPQRHWQELRIPLPTGAARAELDCRADVAQLGAIALALDRRSAVARP